MSGEEHKPKLSDPEKLYAKTSLSRTREASKDQKQKFTCTPEKLKGLKENAFLLVACDSVTLASDLVQTGFHHKGLSRSASDI